MSESHLRDDVTFLASHLIHRTSNTESERAAAEYIASRLRQYVPDTEIDDFYSVDSMPLVLASFYAEFVVVALIGYWWPLAGFAYGIFVFFCYLAEITGFRLVGRLLPQYETQNVAARIIGGTPSALFVVTAHYDSPKASFLNQPSMQPWLRPLHFIVLFAMLAVCTGCFSAYLGLGEAAAIPWDSVLRWSGLLILFGAAIFLLYSDYTAGYGRGTVNNATGVAVLIELARRVQETPLSSGDAWFVATGAKESGLNGMRHLLRTHKLPKDTTFFLNLDGFGGGDLRYSDAEGLVRTFGHDGTLAGSAARLAPEFTARRYIHRGWPTDALLPLARGYDALTLSSERGGEARTRNESAESAPTDIDFDRLTKAVDFAESILREAAQGGPIR